MPLSLYLLALGVFAMGTSEFMLAGLLPAIASDLGVPVGTAGLLTSAFAVGMVVGAPLMAVVTRAWSPRLSLVLFVVVFLAAHVVGAVTTNFAVLLASRTVAALANAGFLAVALTTASASVPPERRGRALAVLLSGTTVATIAGVPGGALLGTAFGWRATFFAVAVLCVPAALGVLKGVPARRDRVATPALRPELAELGKPRLAAVIVLAVFVNAVTFGHFTFLAPVVTDVAGLGEWWVPVALVLFGVGSFLGVQAGGRLSDFAPRPVVLAGGPLVLAGWWSLDLLGTNPVALLVLVFVLGALSFAVGSTVIARVLHHAGGAPTMAGSYATAALNAGAVIGPVVFSV
ncbi:MFS transporter, DHA1 family, chloramphenicol resistance protein [Lentzea fradiae]|uniref:MFS transporter, DHA1 family, chloramphenicol resistance protein n=1 Tax=Lentzea fradiae TaxID=200378 RepID=A0A1G7M4X6_9PSEU|nr:Cmx/CmrA family chloramphenicol efflux MFS transporter [Lentzea fradiae]SDF56858.1 MFS transporter, DHA1 family, chloramphenicol resistance protein [Lentzea fradiae]